MSKQTAIEWILEQTMYMRSTKWPDIIEQALEMDKKQHGDTWDAAIKAYMDRGHNVVRAIVDFDEYWAEKSKTPPGEHCEEA